MLYLNTVYIFIYFIETNFYFLTVVFLISWFFFYLCAGGARAHVVMAAVLVNAPICVIFCVIFCVTPVLPNYM